MQVYFLLDRSGSMETLWSEALGSINGYVKNLPKNTKIQLAVFDSMSYDVIRDTITDNWVELTNVDALPRGGTPLYDSAVRMMDRAFENNDERTIFVVMTDGFENSSQHYRKNDVQNRVKLFENRGWEVVFLGANFDKIDTVSYDSGIKTNKFMNISAQNMTYAMGTTVAATSSDYLTRGIPINYTDQMKKEAEEV